MRLAALHVKNFRCIVDSSEINIAPLQALVGENNTGKSTLLYTVDIFLSSGVAGVGEKDFFDASKPIIITGTFTDLSRSERQNLRPYLLGDKLILEKHLMFDLNGKVTSEYHGYSSQPKDWWLSTDGVIEHEGSTRPNWKKVAEEHGIYDLVKDDKGKVNKASYEKGLNHILVEKEEIEFLEPELGNTQALGIPQNLLRHLPSFHLLPAITDYSDEIDKRSTKTSFRRLMADFSDRLIKSDPRYKEIESHLDSISELLNIGKNADVSQPQPRLEIFGKIEGKLTEIIADMMPSVQDVKLDVVVGDVKEIFSQGVTMRVNDGMLTDVLDKGHGLQRCVVFALIKALILNERGLLLPTSNGDQSNREAGTPRPMLLAIEEPELYIHPQMQRLLYRVLRDFTLQTDQVIYSTHSPLFIDLTVYDTIAVVHKHTVENGCHVHQCDVTTLGDPSERKPFQLISSFDLDKNRLFFANRIILVDGPQDVIAVTAVGRSLGLFQELPEEIGFTVIDTECKQEAKKFIKLLNAFHIPYIYLHELDDKPDDPLNKEIKDLLAGNPSVELAKNLEHAVAYSGHFSSTYTAKKYFEENADKAPDPFKRVVETLFAFQPIS